MLLMDQMAAAMVYTQQLRCKCLSLTESTSLSLCVLFCDFFSLILGEDNAF